MREDAHVAFAVSDLHVGVARRLDTALQKAPDNYRKLIRLGSYGSFFNYYMCVLTLRVSDLQGRTAVFPWIKQEGGRCAEN